MIILFVNAKERIITDVRVFEPKCNSYKDQVPAKLYTRQEQEKIQ